MGGEFRSSGSLLRALARLVDTSLILAEDRRNGRFRMLDTLRQFGHEQLAAGNAADGARRRHAAYFADLGEHAQAELFGPDQLRWHRLLEPEQDNFRAALAWAAEQRDAMLLL